MPRIFDFSRPLTPGTRGVALDSHATLARDRSDATTWHLYAHAGTRMDSPVYFAAGLETIDPESRPPS